MATREENIKAINAELERMSENELEQIAGGSRSECAADSHRLAKFSLMRSYSSDSFLGGKHDNELRIAWNYVGIDIEIHTGNIFTGGKANKYRLDGKEITQAEAWQHLYDVMGDK